MQRAARRIVEKLRHHTYEAFFVGGWVRDFLLGRRSKDIDIATSALPHDILQLFPNSLPIGAKFGVIQVRMYGRAYEVATFRSEGQYLNGRRPSEVKYSSAKEDARRRDFTVNGLFYDPLTERVIDLVQGRRDIRHKILRTIGNPQERFNEDKLRMLRAIRLSCNLGFEIERKSLRGICEMAPTILDISWERIRDELIRTITGPAKSRGLHLLAETGLLGQILPEVNAMKGIAQPPEFHPEGDVFTHTCAAMDLLRKPSPVLALGTLLHDVGKPPTFILKERIRFDGHTELGAEISSQICQRLRMSNEETEQVVDLVQNHHRFMQVKAMRASTLKRFLRKPNFRDHLELHRVDCLSSRRSLENFHFCRKKHKELMSESAPLSPLLTGNDLIIIGYNPGPLFKRILRAVEDQQLEGAIRTKNDACEFVKQSFPLSPKRKIE